MVVIKEKVMDESLKNLRARRSPRQPVKIRAFLHFGGRFQSTIITDLSSGGAGLQGAVGVIAGDKITLEFLDGRTVAAQVKWWLAGNCGIAFDSELAKDDPLLTNSGSLRRYKK